MIQRAKQRHAPKHDWRPHCEPKAQSIPVVIVSKKMPKRSDRACRRVYTRICREEPPTCRKVLLAEKGPSLNPKMRVDKEQNQRKSRHGSQFPPEAVGLGSRDQAQATKPSTPSKVPAPGSTASIWFPQKPHGPFAPTCQLLRPLGSSPGGAQLLPQTHRCWHCDGDGWLGSDGLSDSPEFHALTSPHQFRAGRWLVTQNLG